MCSIDHSGDGVEIKRSAHIRTSQHLHAQIAVDLTHDLDGVADRKMRVAGQMRRYNTICINRCRLAAKLRHLAYDPYGLVGEGVEELRCYARG